MIVQDFSACTLKTKYKTLHYFKTYKAKVENQLERKKSNRYDVITVGVFLNEFSTFCNKYGIIYRGRHYNHNNLMGLPKERTML